MLSAGSQLLDEHGTERDGPGARLCRAHDRNVLPCGASLADPLSTCWVGPPLSALEGVGGGLEVDAEGIATPAAQGQPIARRLLDV